MRICSITNVRPRRWAAIPAALFVLLLVGPALHAGNFRVAPITLELAGGAKSGAFSVINEGSETMKFQVSASEWTQDEKGKDVYTDTQDIVFFPKMLSVEPGTQRVIRVGTKGSPPAREKTYRLFIQEIPAPAQDKKARATLSIVIRFAPPIFWVPLSPKRSGSFESAVLAQGVLTAVVKNTGTAHFLISTVTARGVAADGSEVFSKEIKGWYLLQGASRAYELPVPKEQCTRLARIELSLKSDTITLSRTVDVRTDMCGQ